MLLRLYIKKFHSYIITTINSSTYCLYSVLFDLKFNFKSSTFALKFSKGLYGDLYHQNILANIRNINILIQYEDDIDIYVLLAPIKKFKVVPNYCEVSLIELIDVDRRLHNSIRIFWSDQQMVARYLDGHSAENIPYGGLSTWFRTFNNLKVVERKSQLDNYLSVDYFGEFTVDQYKLNKTHLFLENYIKRSNKVYNNYHKKHLDDKIIPKYKKSLSIFGVGG